MTKIAAKDLLGLLRLKHKGDVFVPECKNGQSYGEAGHLRLDALVINRSWSNATVDGYEIKVSRRDFLGDDKWPGYLKYCNRFSFVCPSGLIQPEEVGDMAGLMWASKTGSRLYTKKKAPYRDASAADLERVFRYILMCRADIISSSYMTAAGTDAEYWQRWMAQKEQDADFGHRVGRKIREVLDREVFKAECENVRLTAENKRYEEVKQAIEGLGLGSYGSASRQLKDLADKAKNGISNGLRRALARAESALDEADVIVNAEEVSGRTGRERE